MLHCRIVGCREGCDWPGPRDLSIGSPSRCAVAGVFQTCKRPYVCVLARFPGRFPVMGESAGPDHAPQYPMQLLERILLRRPGWTLVHTDRGRRGLEPAAECNPTPDPAGPASARHGRDRRTAGAVHPSRRDAPSAGCRQRARGPGPDRAVDGGRGRRVHHRTAGRRGRTRRSGRACACRDSVMSSTQKLLAVKMRVLSVMLVRCANAPEAGG